MQSVPVPASGIDAEAVKHPVLRAKIDADQRIAGGEVQDRYGRPDGRIGEIECDEVEAGQRIGA